MSAPLIVTLEADPASQARFAAARTRWFPAARNVVPAHVTLFHQLPGLDAPEAALRLHEIARETAPLPFAVAGIMPLGRGCAYRLELPGGTALRDRVGRGIDRKPQDRGRLRAHVTIQNKVARDVAAVTLQAVQAGFVPWDGRIDALRLWRYQGGPWEAAGRFALAGATAAGSGSPGP
ncbi:2'-5' RNA ligase family protein [Jannaschia ovalis]|uniref:2'-5' RNA ligase family protein n=1 Tax=Jannaschia ovalis TaxID=3038773 RepID=A0ABY8LBQ8_9RHOB|nr:2'-5' RNA ligase family protein [Jannaschia sp. GRR-S6-38]WGH77715.1 2'-5' RNA ligase family protein [Jannaschia sp. GRR-S6-38]